MGINIKQYFSKLGKKATNEVSEKKWIPNIYENDSKKAEAERYFMKERGYFKYEEAKLMDDQRYFMNAEDKMAVLNMDKIENTTGTIIGVDIETGLVCTPKDNLRLNGHKCITGGHGVGSETYVLGELLQTIKRNESFITTDNNMVLYELSANIAKKEGYEIVVLNLINLDSTAAYDYLGNLRSKTGDQEEEIRRATDLAEIIINNISLEVSDYSAICQAKLLTAAILFCMYDDTGITKPILADAFDLIIKNDKSALDNIFNALGDEHPAKDPYQKYSNAEYRSSIISELISRLYVYQTDNLKRIISENEIDLTLPGRKKCAYYIIMSNETNSYDFIANMFLSTFFTKIKEYADAQINRRCAIPVNLFIDELHKIKKIPDFGKTLAIIRSRNVFINIVLRNYAEMQKMYSATEWESIMACCDINIYLGSNDESTIAYFSKRIGKKPKPVKDRGCQSAVSETKIQTEPVSLRMWLDDMTQNVMTEEELSHFPQENSIVFMKLCYPLIVKKCFGNNHPLYERTNLFFR